jgi:hypothetical protein
MDKFVAKSKSESENELFGVSRQLSSQVAAGSSTVAFQNSSDIHVGPRHQNNTPVSVNEYVTVINDDYGYTDITPQQPESANPVGKYS